MIRALIGLALSSVALKLAELAARLLRPPVDDSHPSRRAESPYEPRGCRAVESSAPPLPDRYVRELASLSLARADSVLGVALRAEGSLYLMGHFSKTPDTRWPQ